MGYDNRGRFVNIYMRHEARNPVSGSISVGRVAIADRGSSLDRQLSDKEYEYAHIAVYSSESAPVELTADAAGIKLSRPKLLGLQGIVNVLVRCVKSRIREHKATSGGYVVHIDDIPEAEYLKGQLGKATYTGKCLFQIPGHKKRKKKRKKSGTGSNKRKKKKFRASQSSGAILRALEDSKGLDDELDRIDAKESGEYRIR